MGNLRSIKSFMTVSVVFAILSLLLSGCMMWMHGTDHGGPDHQMQQPGKTLMKEFSDRDVTLSLDAPPLGMGGESLLILKVSRIRSGAPITGAKVTFLIEQGEQPVEGHAGHHGKAAVEREADEIAGKGMYQLRYTFEEQGLYRTTARVWLAEKEDAAAPLTITLIQDVGRHEGHGAEQSATPWVVIGGIGMAMMMLFMVL